MVEFISEISSNHENDLGRMKELISASKEAGCSGVKFQLFKIDELFSEEAIKKYPNINKRRAWELNEKYLPELAEYSHKIGVKFGCTPFHLQAVDLLEQYVDFYKIASYELLWLDLFKKCGNTDKPIIFSTGMATLHEVDAAFKTLILSGCRNLTILHCNSAYPTPVKDANLSAIDELKSYIVERNPEQNIFNLGYSDHTVSPAVLYRAIYRYGAGLVEFHIDLDGKGAEYSSGHCWLPDQISKVITTVNQGFVADGTGHFGPSTSELEEREWRTDPSDGLRPSKGKRTKL